MNRQYLCVLSKAKNLYGKCNLRRYKVIFKLSQIEISYIFRYPVETDEKMQLEQVSCKSFPCLRADHQIIYLILKVP